MECKKAAANLRATKLFVTGLLPSWAHVARCDVSDFMSDRVVAARFRETVEVSPYTEVMK